MFELEVSHKRNPALWLSVVLDKVGFLGLVEREITPGRIVGVVLLAAGVFLVVRS